MTVEWQKVMDYSFGWHYYAAENNKCPPQIFSEVSQLVRNPTWLN